jgi:hypothetical protein
MIFFSLVLRNDAMAEKFEPFPGGGNFIYGWDLLCWELHFSGGTRFF